MSVSKNINTVTDPNKTNEYDSKVKLIKAGGYSVMPRQFAQNENLSIETIGLGAYLNSLPHDWTPRRSHLQKHFGFGDHVWRKIAKELRDEGYLKLEKGGHGGGCDLVFDIEGSFRHVENQRVGDGDALITDASKSDASKINAHTNYTSVQNTNIKKTTTIAQVPVVDKVVVDLIKSMKDVGVTDKDAQYYLDIYTHDKISEKLSMLKESKAEKPAAWLRAALRENWPPSKPKHLTTISSVGDTEQIKHAYESALQQADVRIDGYIANMTPEELEEKIRVEEYWKEKLGFCKYEDHSASI